MRRADLGNVHLEAGMLANQRARRAGVVEMDVREQKMAQVAQHETALGTSSVFSAVMQVDGPQSWSASPSSVSTR